METNIHRKEEAIQSVWLKMAEANSDAESRCTDGLLFRGPISYADGYWSRKKGEEETLWRNAPRKLLILTKDLNDDEGWDVRQETGRYNEIAFSYERAISFYKNLRMWSYLMLKGEIGNIPSFKDARNMNIVGPFYETAPIARVNCKKQVGGGSISDTLLMQYLETYAEPLMQQIRLYDADIIYCCGFSNDRNIIMDFVWAHYLTDLESVPNTDGWFYYSPSTGKLVVNSYHPSARIGYEETYYGLADAYGETLKWIKEKYNKTF